MNEQTEWLFTAATSLVRYRTHGLREYELELYDALDQLLAAMVGKRPEDWGKEDLDKLELGAKAVCAVFGVGFTLSENIMVRWELL